MDLQETRHVTATTVVVWRHCACASCADTKKNCCCIVGRVCVAGVTYDWICMSQYECVRSTLQCLEMLNYILQFANTGWF
jgi:hypothetical protein